MRFSMDMRYCPSVGKLEYWPVPENQLEIQDLESGYLQRLLMESVRVECTWLVWVLILNQNK